MLDFILDFILIIIICIYVGKTFEKAALLTSKRPKRREYDDDDY